MTPRDPTEAEKTMAHAIIRWWRAQHGPRHAQTNAENVLADIARKLLEEGTPSETCVPPKPKYIPADTEGSTP